MADIAGIGGGSNPFGLNPSRSTPEEIQARENESRRRVEQEEPTVRPAEDGADTAAPAEETNGASGIDTDQETTADRGGQELREDTVSLSRQAEEAIATNERPPEPATPAAGETNVVAGDTRATNQVTRQEDTTTEVNGNQNNQSETTRTLGQVVDQFA
jgi:hypothetical protein